MPRIRQVSRTFTSLEVTARCVNIEKECFEELKFIIKHPTNDKAKLLRLCKREAKPPYDPIKIIRVDQLKCVYSMLEQDFLDHAVMGYITKENAADSRKNKELYEKKGKEENERV